MTQNKLERARPQLYWQNNLKGQPPHNSSLTTVSQISSWPCGGKKKKASPNPLNAESGDCWSLLPTGIPPSPFQSSIADWRNGWGGDGHSGLCLLERQSQLSFMQLCIGRICPGSSTWHIAAIERYRVLGHQKMQFMASCDLEEKYGE